MAGIVEIRYRDAQRGVSVELADLLALVAPEGRGLVWAILALEAWGDLPGGRHMLDLEREVERSPQGLLLGWEGLAALAPAFFQVLEGLFVGCRDAAAIPRLGPGADLYTPSELVIEAFDGWLWRVYARDDRVVRRLQGAFRDTEVVPLP